mmetsp:Transcript_18183/g.55732  ORF Transcript_18183/g.55732 Transcript_18183/m.55732 type:complete len:322 (+) Transcript_18183:199-1164(+)
MHQVSILRWASGVRTCRRRRRGRRGASSSWGRLQEGGGAAPKYGGKMHRSRVVLKERRRRTRDVVVVSVSCVSSVQASKQASADGRKEGRKEGKTGRRKVKFCVPRSRRLLDFFLGLVVVALFVVDDDDGGAGEFDVVLGLFLVGGDEALDFVGLGDGGEDGAVGELDVAVGEHEREAEDGGDVVGHEGAALAVDDGARVEADGGDGAAEEEVGRGRNHAQVGLDRRQAQERDGRVVEEGRADDLDVEAAGPGRAADAADLALDLEDGVPRAGAIQEEVAEAAGGAAFLFVEDVRQRGEEAVAELVAVHVQVAELFHRDVQ